jgi:NADPH:quinone reductase-like Zn-dependent oxidoreductase
LIIGGMDGVGQALIQMCNKARATIYATAPAHRHGYVNNVLGAAPYPEEKETWIRMVEHKMDYVFDGVCEDGWETPFRALKDDGELVCYGHAAMLKERSMGFLGAPMSAHMNKLWSQTKPRTNFVDIWESFQEDPETYKKN